MAIPEACGVWIEQRVKEEIEAKGESGASLREIGRKVAAEVEKYFEAKVNPRTIEKKAERVAATNVAPKENTTKTEVKSGDTGDKSTMGEAIKIMKSEVDSGKSTREAAKVAATKTGAQAESVKRTFHREEKKKKRFR